MKKKEMKKQLELAKQKIESMRESLVEAQQYKALAINLASNIHQVDYLEKDHAKLEKDNKRLQEEHTELMQKIETLNLQNLPF